MQYSYISAAFLALASTVAGQVFFDAIQTPQRDEVLTPGKPFDLVWNPLDVKGTSTIQLQYGASNITLQFGPILKAGIDNQAGKFTWTPADLGYAVYGWTITLDSDKTKVQTSLPFSIKKAGGTTTVKVSPGPSYTSTPSSTSSSSTTSKTSSQSTTSLTPTETPYSNSTASTSTLIETTIRSNPTTPTTKGGPSPTTTPTPQSSSAAMANIVSGGLAALGGVLMAFAL